MQIQSAPSLAVGDDGPVKIVEDAAVRDFYKKSVGEAYRLKSELVGQHLETIGMGK